MKKFFKRLFCFILCVNLIFSSSIHTFAANSSDSLDILSSAYLLTLAEVLGNDNDILVDNKYLQYSEVLNKFANSLIGGEELDSYKNILKQNQENLKTALNSSNPENILTTSAYIKWALSIPTLVDIYNKAEAFKEIDSHYLTTNINGGLSTKIFACLPVSHNSKSLVLYDTQKALNMCKGGQDYGSTLGKLDNLLSRFLTKDKNIFQSIGSAIANLFGGGNTDVVQKLYKITDSDTKKKGIYALDALNSDLNKSLIGSVSGNGTAGSSEEARVEAFNNAKGGGKTVDTIEEYTVEYKNSSVQDDNDNIYGFLTKCINNGYMGYVTVRSSAKEILDQFGNPTGQWRGSCTIEKHLISGYTWAYNSPPSSPSFCQEFFLEQITGDMQNYSSNTGYPSFSSQISSNGATDDNINSSIYQFNYADVTRKLSEINTLFEPYMTLLNDSTTNTQKLAEVGWDLVMGSGWFERGDEYLETGDIFKVSSIPDKIKALNMKTLIESLSKNNQWNGDTKNNLGSSLVVMLGNLPVLVIDMNEPNPDATITLQQSIQKRQLQGDMAVKVKDPVTKKTSTVTIDYTPNIMYLKNFNGNEFDLEDTGLIYDFKLNEIRIDDSNQNNVSASNNETLKNYIEENSFWVAPKGHLLLTKYFPLYKTETNNEWLPLGRACYLNTANLSFDSLNKKYSIIDAQIPLFYMSDPITNTQVTNEGKAEKVYVSDICDYSGNLASYVPQITQQGSPDPSNTFDGNGDTIVALQQ